MFTGIIEEIGLVIALIRGSQSAKLTVSVARNISETKVGDSISINGVCLTAANIRKNFIEFDISSETLKRADLQYLKVGDKVNIERALLLSGRLGGHMVTGHIDGMGEIRNKISYEKDFSLHISVPSELLHYMVVKGSITIDGVSLTITDLRDGLLMVNVVPHTAKASTLGQLNIGDRVNLEVDILSKYIERHLKRETGSVTEDTMVRVGFLPMGWIDN